MRRKAVLATLVVAAGALALAVALTRGPSPDSSTAASHREAPLISQDPTVDVTDLYAFVSPDKPDTVTLIADWIPFEEPSAGPNWYSFAKNARYEINVDNTGDAQADVTYRFTFRDASTGFGPLGCISGPCQVYTLTQIKGGHAKVLAKNVAVGPNNIGPGFTPGYPSVMSSEVNSLSNGGLVFVGQADDPFFGDIGAAFDKVTIRNDFGSKGGGKDTFAGYNVHVTALQLPKSELRGASGDTIGVWAASSRPVLTVKRGHKAVEWRQVARLGNPLMNELIVPTTEKDAWNSQSPATDAAYDTNLLNPILAGVINGLYGLQIPTANRTDLLAVFHQGLAGLNKFGSKSADMLRLNMSIPPTADPNRYGAALGDNAGWPNGRRLGDDVIDIAENGLEGALFTPKYWPVVLGDGVDGNDKPYQAAFPYVAAPHDGLTNSHGATQPVTP